MSRSSRSDVDPRSTSCSGSKCRSGQWQDRPWHWKEGDWHWKEGDWQSWPEQSPASCRGWGGGWIAENDAVPKAAPTAAPKAAPKGVPKAAPTAAPKAAPKAASKAVPKAKSTGAPMAAFRWLRTEFAANGKQAIAEFAARARADKHMCSVVDGELHIQCGYNKEFFKALNVERHWIENSQALKWFRENAEFGEFGTGPLCFSNDSPMMMPVIKKSIGIGILTVGTSFHGRGRAW